MYARDLARVLPAVAANGDRLALVDRADVFRLLRGLIRPVQDRFVAVEHDPRTDPRLWLTHAEEIQAGRARLLADVNSEAGRTAFLDLWWPADRDGACVSWTAEAGKGHERALPYPVSTMLRTAVIMLRLAPDLMFTAMRFGVIPTTTTVLRANWDVGIRRILFHPTPHFHTWLTEQGGLARCAALAPDDPLRIWTYAPGHTEAKEHAYILHVQDRPQTDDYLAWLKGAA